MTAAKEPSVDGIVAELDAWFDPTYRHHMRSISALISDWRKRGEARDIAHAELDALGASHKDLAHRLARIGGELEKEREERDEAKELSKHWHARYVERLAERNYAQRECEACAENAKSAIAERDYARALLRSARGVIIFGQTLLRDEGFGRGTCARIAKELGPTREDEPHSPRAS